jgi:hypothetical protein
VSGTLWVVHLIALSASVALAVMVLLPHSAGEQPEYVAVGVVEPPSNIAGLGNSRDADRAAGPCYRRSFYAQR